MLYSKDFCQIIVDEFLKRRSRNTSYSQRAFARDIGISKSSLNNILHEKATLSARLAKKIGLRIGVTEMEIDEIFKTEKPKREEISQKEFSKIYHWYYFAILNLAETKKAKSSPEWIAKRLGLEEDIAKKALDQLAKMKFIKRTRGNLTRTKEYLDASWSAPSRSLRNLHSENLYRAEKALSLVPIDKREVTSLTLAIDKSQYKKIQKAALKFRKKINEITQDKSEATDVYTVAMQIFPQTMNNEL